MLATSDVVDVQSQSQARSQRGLDAGGLARLMPPRPRPMRPRGSTWCSSLAPDDLTLLLGVIETSLLPRLIESFPPARQSALAAQKR